MLTRYRMVRGERFAEGVPLPDGIRLDIRKHTRHVLRPNPASVVALLAAPTDAAFGRFARKYETDLEARFAADRAPFDELAELSREHDVYLGCSCPTKANPDVRHCHTTLALAFMKRKYKLQSIRQHDKPIGQNLSQQKEQGDSKAGIKKTGPADVADPAGHSIQKISIPTGLDANSVLCSSGSATPILFAKYQINEKDGCRQCRETEYFFCINQVFGKRNRKHGYSKCQSQPDGIKESLNQNGRNHGGKTCRSPARYQVYAQNLAQAHGQDFIYKKARINSLSCLKCRDAADGMQQKAPAHSLAYIAENVEKDSSRHPPPIDGCHRPDQFLDLDIVEDPYEAQHCDGVAGNCLPDAGGS